MHNANSVIGFPAVSMEIEISPKPHDVGQQLRGAFVGLACQ
jgi:hypothetical protein